jgi:ribosomal protein S8
MLFRSSLGILNQAIKKKYVFIIIPYSNKGFQLIKLLYNLGYINTYNISSNQIHIYFKVFKNEIILNKLYFYSRPGHIKTVSYKQLINLKNKKDKFYILFNSLGICTSATALLYKKGGILIAEIT